MVKYNNPKSLEIETMTTKSKLEGFGGWLLFFIICFCLGALSALIFVIVGIIENLPVLSIAGIVFFLFTIFLLNLIFNKRKAAVSWIKGLYIFSFVMYGIYFLPVLLHPIDLEVSFIGSFVSNLATYLYFVRSVRVKNTFVN